MATMTLQFPNGTTKVATGPDGLSDDQRHQDAQEIMAQAIKADPSLGHAPGAGTDASLATQFLAGAHEAGAGLQATAQTAAATAGPGAVADAANTTRSTLANITPNMPANAADPSAEAIKEFKAGNYAKAAAWLPAAGARSIPELIAMLGAGAITRSPAGPAAIIGAIHGGENVQARQANNGHGPDDAPTSGELGVGLATTAGQAALGTIGVRVPGINKIASAPVRAGVNVLADGASGAANSALGQVGQTAGTDSGLSVDPYRVGMAGVAQATARVASVVPHVIGAGGHALGDKISEWGVRGPEDAAQATAMKAADQAVQDVMAKSTRPIEYHEAANTARGDLAERLVSVVRAARDAGEISPEAWKDGYARVVEAASRHNQDLADVPGGALGVIRDNPLTGDRGAQFQEAAGALNVLSTNARANRQSGPAQKILGALGGFISTGAGGYTGNPLGIIAGLAGHSAGNRIGSGVGRVIDNMFGAAGPDLPIQARLANRFLDKSGSNPDVQSPLVTSKNLMDSTPTLRQDLGTPEVPITGVNDPATGRPFADIQSAIAHGSQNDTAVNYQDPTRHINPFVIKPSQIAGLQDPRASSDSWLRGEVTRSTQQTQKGLNEAGTNALRDQEVLDAQTKATAAKKLADTIAMSKQASAQRANEDVLQAQKDASFGKAEKSTQDSVDSAGRQFDSAQSSQARSDAVSTRTNTAQMNAEIAQRNQTLDNRTRMVADLQKLQQKAMALSEGGAIDRILSQKRRSDQADDPQLEFDRTNGRRGNPAEPGDPLMVKADGTPIQAPSGTSTRAPRTQSARAVAQDASQAPTASTAALMDVPAPNGQVIPGNQWVSYIRNKFERSGASADQMASVTHGNAVKAAYELASAGHIPTDIAQALETHHGHVQVSESNPSDPIRLIAGRLGQHVGLKTVDPAGAPTSGPVAQAQAAASAGIRNPLSYAQNLRQEQAAAQNIVQTHPEMADAVNRMRDATKNSKTKEGRMTVLRDILKDVPADQRQTWATVLGPLAGYGQ